MGIRQDPFPTWLYAECWDTEEHLQEMSTNKHQGRGIWIALTYAMMLMTLQGTNVSNILAIISLCAILPGGGDISWRFQWSFSITVLNIEGNVIRRQTPVDCIQTKSACSQAELANQIKSRIFHPHCLMYEMNAF